MNRRRRNILIACAALVVGVGLAAWFGLRSGKVEVQLRFHRFTNFLYISRDFPGALPRETNHLPTALFIVTNSGSVPVKFERLGSSRVARRTGGSSVGFQAFIWTTNGNVPLVLHPGESAFAVQMLPTVDTNLSYDIAFTQHGLRERVSDKLSQRGFVRLQQFLVPPAANREILWATSDTFRIATRTFTNYAAYGSGRDEGP